MRLSHALLGLAVLTLARAASAQTRGGAVERFEPAAPGDAMFGVPSPAIGGHLVPRASLYFDFAYKPLSIEDGNKRESIVSRQGVLHLAASFALWDRLMISVDMPFVLLQGGDNPVIDGTTFNSPSGAQVGDLRLGARARLFGGYWDPFQIGVGGYVFVPTAPKGSYAGDGAVRGEPQLLLGGRFTHFVWSAALGTTIHASAHPHTFSAGGGAAVVLADDMVQIGPEVTLAVPFTKDTSLSTPTTTITAKAPLAAEVLVGAKVRPVRAVPALVFGAGAGPGLTTGWGTPKLFTVATIGYDPQPSRFADNDGDKIPDAEDACPDVPGVRSNDPKKNGCPPDSDGDGIADAEDACPTVKGVHSDDPKKNGCPPDRDNDGIADAEDACPDVKGVHSDDPKKNGCPSDRDEDGIADAEDACPDTKGVADPDPKKNGCPRVVVTRTEIVINQQVKFLFGKSRIDQTVDPVSDSLLEEVRGAIVDHPEIERIEIQGHTDIVGTEGFNKQLSEARADAVRLWLVKHGINGKKLTTRGFGSSAPLASNDTDAGRQENRRVQFKIVKRGADKP